MILHLLQKKALFERCLISLKGDEGKNPVRMKSFSEAEELVDEISAILEKIRILGEEKEKAKKDILNLEPWGDFNPADIIELGSKGIGLGFYELTNEIFSEVSDKIEFFPVNQIKIRTMLRFLNLMRVRKFSAAPVLMHMPQYFPKQVLKSLRKQFLKRS